MRHGFRRHMKNRSPGRMVAGRAIQIDQSALLVLAIVRIIKMLVRMMPHMILSDRRLFVLAILGHGGITPLERQHAKNEDGNESTHTGIMPDMPSARLDICVGGNYAWPEPRSNRSPLATTIRLAPALANTAIDNAPRPVNNGCQVMAWAKT